MWDLLNAELAFPNNGVGLLVWGLRPNGNGSAANVDAAAVRMLVVACGDCLVVGVPA